jgi:hypothetical protein
MAEGTYPYVSTFSQCWHLYQLAVGLSISKAYLVGMIPVGVSWCFPLLEGAEMPDLSIVA